MSDEFFPRMPVMRPPVVGARLVRVPIGEEILAEVLIERPGVEIPQPPTVLELEEPTPFVASPVLGFLDIEIAQSAQRIALADARVKGLLTEGRYASIGPTLSAAKGEEGRPTVKYVFYNYANDTVVEATVIIETSAVTAVDQKKYQPPPTQEEIGRAIAKAAADDRIVDRIKREELEGSGILVTPEKADDLRASHRLIDVRFGRPESPLPVLQALVDLSTDEVVTAGPVE